MVATFADAPLDERVTLMGSMWPQASVAERTMVVPVQDE